MLTLKKRKDLLKRLGSTSFGKFGAQIIEHIESEEENHYNASSKNIPEEKKL